MKFVFLTLVVLFSSHTFATQTETEKQLLELRQQWDNDFNNYLINHEDANIAMFGLYRAAQHNKQFGDIAETLNQLLETNSLSAQSYFLAFNLCNRTEMLGFCDIESIDKNFRKSEPSNLAVYLTGLNLAIKQSDNKKVKSLLKQMVNTNHTDTYNYLPEKLEEVIEKYIDLNPIDEQLKQFELIQLKQLYKFSSYEKSQLENNFHQYQKISTLLNFKLSLPISNFRGFINECRAKKGFKKHCLKIAEILIKGKSYIAVGVGNAIKVEVYESNGTQQQHEQAVTDKELFKKQMGCVSKKSGTLSFFDTLFNIEMYKSFSRLERTQGELAAFVELSKIANQKQLDISPESATNPESCLE